MITAYMSSLCMRRSHDCQLTSWGDGGVAEIKARVIDHQWRLDNSLQLNASGYIQHGGGG